MRFGSLKTGNEVALSIGRFFFFKLVRHVIYTTETNGHVQLAALFYFVVSVNKSAIHFRQKGYKSCLHTRTMMMMKMEMKMMMMMMERMVMMMI